RSALWRPRIVASVTCVSPKRQRGELSGSGGRSPGRSNAPRGTRPASPQGLSEEGPKWFPRPCRRLSEPHAAAGLGVLRQDFREEGSQEQARRYPTASSIVTPRSRRVHHPDIHPRTSRKPLTCGSVLSACYGARAVGTSVPSDVRKDHDAVTMRRRLWPGSR